MLHNMDTAKITSKGQITIPKKIRDRLGVAEGERVYFVEKGGQMIIKKAVPKSPFDQWVGYLKAKKGQKSDAIVDALRGK